jgi:hypothetical protein
LRVFVQEGLKTRCMDVWKIGEKSMVLVGKLEENEWTSFKAGDAFLLEWYGGCDGKRAWTR